MPSRTMTTYLQADLDLCAGEPDGPLVFIDLIGFEVPSYINDRYDLIVPGQVKGKGKLTHHVPFKLRGPYKPEDLPESGDWDKETNEEGFAICESKKKDGLPCRALAINRSQFCGVHGGALHPADRQIKNLGDGIVPDSSKVRKLDRAQKVGMGLIAVDALSDVEVHGMFVINDDGRQVKSKKISDKIHQAMSKELLIRMNDFMVETLPVVLTDMAQIAHDPSVEPGDRIKAAVWLAERVIGKTPDVVLHGTADKPYEQIITRVESGSREDYRRALESSNIIEGEVVEDGDIGSDGDPHGTGDSVSPQPPMRVDGVGVSDLDSTRQDSGDDQSHNGSLAVDVRSDALANSLASTVSRKARLTAAREEQRVAKNRRYAARAAGANNMTDLPFLLEYKRRKDGTYSVRFWPAEDQTPELVDRIQRADLLDQIPQQTA